MSRLVLKPQVQLLKLPKKGSLLSPNLLQLEDWVDPRNTRISENDCLKLPPVTSEHWDQHPEEVGSRSQGRHKELSPGK